MIHNRIIVCGVKPRVETDEQRERASRLTEQLRRDLTAACDRAEAQGHLTQFRAAEDAFESAVKQIEAGGAKEAWAEIAGNVEGKFVRREFVADI